MPDTKRIRAGYHNLLRREILELVPTGAKRILDLGCGTGLLGKALKERQKCFVAGIELNKEAYQNAQKNLDAVFHDNLNRFNPSFLNSKFDCLIFADILEHLINPWGILKNFASVLTDDGTIVASIPNLAHPWVISQLQKGLFRYEPAGLLDITHLRFFTKTTISQMFYKAGLKIINIRPYPSDKNPTQYHVTAVRPTLPHENPLTTILILTFNTWGFTQQCINSIKAKTTAPYKILVIDNGSTDKTVGELRKDRSIFHIENSCNLGFGRGFNIGMQIIDTPYFVLCGSDAVVTKDWLTNMLININTDDKLVGLGPVSNCVSGPQIVTHINYNSDETLETFAKNRLEYVTEPIKYFPRIVFFFALFKSRVLREVGLIDEWFETGNFEDDDYCKRIHIKNLKTAIDNTVFIHHYGSQTFKVNKIDYAKIFNENKQKFIEKWHLTQYGR